jgi:hypothetical protein
MSHTADGIVSQVAIIIVAAPRHVGSLVWNTGTGVGLERLKLSSSS